MPVNQTWIILLVILFLMLVNGFFAASEMALVTVRKRTIKKLRDEGNKKAILLDKVTKDSTRYLSTIQVAITLAGFLSSAFAGARLSNSVVQMFGSVGIYMTNNIAVILVTVILSYITLVLGELVPKRIALRHATAFSLFAARPVWIVMIATKPFVKLLSLSTNGVLKLLRVAPQKPEEKITEREIKEMISSGHFEGLYGKNEKDMLESIFRFDDLPAEKIMTPRVNVMAFDIEDVPSDAITMMIESGYSRLPVYKKNLDAIQGIMLIKDILPIIINTNVDAIDIASLLREPYFVPEHIKLNKLFSLMQKKKLHMVFLVGEYGGFTGIVTLEDLVEEIVGNIYDEYDQTDFSIKKQNQNTYLVDGAIQIQELNRRLNIQFDEHNNDYDTLSGLIIYHLGHIPNASNNETLPHKNTTLKPLKTTHKRITKVRIIIHDK